ncbi:protein kinase [candidate division KSB1 bacterium]|nr:protein kinase [candidate division KSB1 bacterium]
MIGKILSHYKILDKLGQGGMGEVYLAEDQKLHRRVAIKLLSPVFILDLEAKQRFIQEAQAAAKLNHPNICTIHEIDEVDDHLFIVMEYIQGQTLQDKIKSASLPIDEIIRIGTQICAGLQEAHQHGIIHRDVKSANIMITSDGQVKIMDFGLARSLGQTRLTKESTSIGTVAYMSFEQASGNEVDHRTDIWSLGVILYEMITGKLPFPGEVDQVIIYSILNKEPSSITDTNQKIPKPLEHIISRALEKDPKERYQHTTDLKKDLEQINKDVSAFRFSRNRRGVRAFLNWRSIVGKWLILIIIIVYGLHFFIHRDHDIHSIAVLPLENLSGNPDQVYFVEGMQDALITQLSQISALRVISKTSTMQFDETRMTIPEIAHILNVDAVLEGSVLREENQVRITAQLIYGSTDEHLWAKSFDRDLLHTLPLISEIARLIVDEINIAVDPHELKRLEKAEPVDIKVHELVLQGRYYLDRFQFDQSLKYYQQAIDLDEEFAPAYVGMSASYLVMGFFGRAPASDMIPKAREYAIKAMALDDNIPGAYTTLGYIQMYYDWDWESARKNLLKALELNPNDALIRHAYADYLMIMGDLEGSLKQVEIGHLYDPLSDMVSTILDFHRILCRQYDEVIEGGRKAIANNPDVIEYLSNYREALWLNGLYEEALNAYKKSWGKDKELLNAIEKGYSELGYQGVPYYLAEALSKRVPKFNDYMAIARLYAHAGKMDSALVWLETAYQFRQPYILHIKAMPAFDELHTHPRFQDLLHRIGFPENDEQ